MTSFEEYKKRLSVLSEEIKKIDFKDLEITPDDLIDPFCDPDNPVKIGFQHISAAACKLKGGIENTPCTVNI